jgi:hypothetical protein
MLFARRLESGRIADSGMSSTCKTADCGQELSGFLKAEMPVDCRSFTGAKHGQEWIRTTEGVSQQIYSLPRLATSVPTRTWFPVRR